MLHQIPLLLLFSAIFMMTLRVSGMGGEEGHRTSSDPHDEHGRRASPPGSAQNDNSARDTGARSGTGANSGTAEHPGLDEANPPQQPPAKQKAVIQFLRGGLDLNPEAGRFTINTEGHLLGAEPLDRDTVIRPNQGRGTMDRLRGILRDVGLGELNDQGILRDQLPNQERFRMGEDPLTRVRVEAIITLIENHVNANHVNANHVNRASNPSESTVHKSSLDSTGGAATARQNTDDPFRDVPDSRNVSEQDGRVSLAGRSVAAVGTAPRQAPAPGNPATPPLSPGSIQAFDIMDFAARHLSRINIIDEQIAAYEEELHQEELRPEEVKNPSSESSHRIFGLKHLIAMLKKAKSYQNDMQKHLERKDYSKVGLQANVIEYLFKINESPNKIERMAHQLAVHIEDLLSDQALLGIVEEHIARHRQGDHQPPQEFLDTRKVLQERITHRRALMEATAAYAELLPPPYEARDEATQAALDQQALTCRRELSLITRSILFRPDHPDLNVAFCNNYEMEARQRSAAEAAREARQRADEEAARPQPREEVSKLLTRAADLYQQAADAYARGDSRRGYHLLDAARALSRAAAEARKPQPQEQVLRRLNQAADLYQQSVAAFAKGETDRGDNLRDAARALSRAAAEAQEPQPREEVITLFTHVADLYQQAAEDLLSKQAYDIYASGHCSHIGRIHSLRSAAEALSNAAEEAQNRQPQKQFITRLTQSADLYQQAADLYQQAADAYASGYIWRGHRLEWVALALSRAAAEARKPQPQEQVVTWFTQSADLYQQAVDADARGDTWRGENLRDAADALSRAAEEAQEPQPREEVITLFTHVADLYQQAAEDLLSKQAYDIYASGHCSHIGRIHSLRSAAEALSNAAEEAQNRQPQKQFITRLTQSADLYQQAADLHQQAAAAFTTGNTERGEHLERAAIALSRAAKEARKTQPQEQVVTWFTQSADLHQQSAAAFAKGEKDRGNYLRSAAEAFSRAAEEAEKHQPQQAIIAECVREAQENIERANPSELCTLS